VYLERALVAEFVAHYYDVSVSQAERCCATYAEFSSQVREQLELRVMRASSILIAKLLGVNIKIPASSSSSSSSTSSSSSSSSSSDFTSRAELHGSSSSESGSLSPLRPTQDDSASDTFALNANHASSSSSCSSLPVNSSSPVDAPLDAEPASPPAIMDIDLADAVVDDPAQAAPINGQPQEVAPVKQPRKKKREGPSLFNRCLTMLKEIHPDELLDLNTISSKLNALVEREEEMPNVADVAAQLLAEKPVLDELHESRNLASGVKNMHNYIAGRGYNCLAKSYAANQINRQEHPSFEAYLKNKKLHCKKTAISFMQWYDVCKQHRKMLRVPLSFKTFAQYLPNNVLLLALKAFKDTYGEFGVTVVPVDPLENEVHVVSTLNTKAFEPAEAAAPAAAAVNSGAAVNAGSGAAANPKAANKAKKRKQNSDGENQSNSDDNEDQHDPIDVDQQIDEDHHDPIDENQHPLIDDQAM
jgi:hypothetical protein